MLIHSTTLIGTFYTALCIFLFPSGVMGANTSEPHVDLYTET